MKKTKIKAVSNFRFIDEFLLIINKITDNLLNLKTKKLAKFIIELVIIILFIMLLKIPFEFIKQLGEKFSSFLFPISSIIIGVWSILIDILYFFFALITFIFIYNKKYPDNKSTKIDKEEYETVYTNMYRILLILSISFPLFITLLILIASFLFSVYLLFQGVTYFSIILIVTSLLLINIIGLIKIYNFMKKTSHKKILTNILLLVGTLVLGLGLSLFSIELTDTKFYANELPPIDYSIKSDTLMTKVDNKTKIICEGCEKNYEIIFDNNLNNELIIETSYYEQYVQSTFTTDRGLIKIKGRHLVSLSPEIKLSIINDLKKKHIYNYNLLYQKQLTIWINEKNRENIQVIVK